MSECVILNWQISVRLNKSFFFAFCASMQAHSVTYRFFFSLYKLNTSTKYGTNKTHTQFCYRLLWEMGNILTLLSCFHQPYNFHISDNRADWLFIQFILQHHLIVWPEHSNVGSAGFSLIYTKTHQHTHTNSEISRFPSLPLTDALTTPSQRAPQNMPRLEFAKISFLLSNTHCAPSQSHST